MTSIFFKYIGPQDEINFREIPSATDVIHTVYNNHNFFQWQEILLINNNCVESWV